MDALMIILALQLQKVVTQSWNSKMFQNKESYSLSPAAQKQHTRCSPLNSQRFYLWRWSQCSLQFWIRWFLSCYSSLASLWVIEKCFSGFSVVYHHCCRIGVSFVSNKLLVQKEITCSFPVTLCQRNSASLLKETRTKTIIFCLK